MWGRFRSYETPYLYVRHHPENMGSLLLEIRSLGEYLIVYIQNVEKILKVYWV